MVWNDTTVLFSCQQVDQWVLKLICFPWSPPCDLCYGKDYIAKNGENLQIKMVFLQEKYFLIYTLILPADIFPGEGSIFTAMYISLKKTKTKIVEE